MDDTSIEFLEEFKEIEPYRGAEFTSALERLKNSQELIRNLRKAAFPDAPFVFKPLLNSLVKIFVKYHLRNVKTPYDFQKSIIKAVIGRIIDKTTTELTFSGLEKLDPQQRYLFISNHRDIVLDPALANYSMTKNFLPTFEIAFGDNLLVNDLVADLIRINKSFIVRRNQQPREQISSTIILSKYIWYTLHTNDSVWIAEREGRAKDGDDLTNPAIIKMFFLSQRKGGLEFSEFINQLKIIPIAISYEFDPCDKLKARELDRRETKESYKKRKGEDFLSMVQGIRDFKGRIHLAFGDVLSGHWEDSKDVAAAIDRFIHKNYKLWPSNYLSWDILNNSDKHSSFYDEKYKEAFLKRFHRLPENVKKHALSAYAKPVENAEKYRF
ncbi:MAG: 1-acyl-sn-glycerol-3-phosphate acyltransferase [Spirochaetia bacterium]|jgi:hypothetical protein|nr:1-acyl-sn-glycerol-3-phosphate acyltransferase [Spirochaetia bacterium]